jgi:hypothetical protein
VDRLLLAIRDDIAINIFYYELVITNVKKTNWAQNRKQKQKLKLLQDQYQYLKKCRKIRPKNHAGDKLQVLTTLDF